MTEKDNLSTLQIFAGNNSEGDMIGIHPSNAVVHWQESEQVADSDEENASKKANASMDAFYGVETTSYWRRSQDRLNTATGTSKRNYYLVWFLNSTKAPQRTKN